MNIRIQVQMNGLDKALETAPAQVKGAIRLSLQRSAVFTQGLFIRNMPKGVSGGLRRSTTHKFTGEQEVQIEPTADQADYVEFGTRPHMPPVDAITAWARSKGANPWAVAYGIAKHGTRKQPFLDRTAVESEAYAGRDMNATIEKTVEDIL